MSKNSLTLLNLNQFLSFINLKKQYLKNIKPVAEFVKNTNFRKIDNLFSLNNKILMTSTMELAVFTFNPFQENTYILYDETLECVIIDPGCHDRSERDHQGPWVHFHQIGKK